MSKKWLWLTIGAVAVVWFVAGVVVAQEGRKYPYLPEDYSQAYIPTKAEWQALRFTAHQNKESYLTEKLLKKGCSVWANGSYLHLVVDTATQADWSTYLGNGRFNCSDRELRAAYEEAADGGAVSIMEATRVYFPAIADQDVQIRFYIRGAAIGIWQGGKLTLEGEE